MDDIYKAAVRDWGGWAYWGLTYLRIGGQGHPREVVGTQERTFTLSGQSLKGMVGLVFQRVKRVRDSGTGEELLEWMEEEVSLFSIMSAPVPKCLWSESLSLSHFYLHLSL